MKKINKRIVLRKSLGLLLAALLAFASLTGCSTTGKEAGTEKCLLLLYRWCFRLSF